MSSYFYLKPIKHPFPSQERRIAERNLDSCCGYELANDIFSLVKIPSYDQALRDGWAVRSNESGPWSLDKQIENGSLPSPLAQGKAAPINTGGYIPIGADCVISKKDAVLSDGKLINLSELHFSEENILKAGSEWDIGQLIIPKGKILTAPLVALLQDANVEKVPVLDRPVVTIIATGEELTSGDLHSANQSKRHASNAFYLRMLLDTLNLADTVFLQVGDNKELLSDALVEASKFSDFIITSGGTGQGSKDLLRQSVLLAKGKLLEDDVRLSDSLPFVRGLIRNTSIYGLPGNPLGFLSITQRFLLKEIWNFSHSVPLTFPKIPVELGFTIEPKPGDVCVQLTTGKNVIVLPVIKGTGRTSSFGRISAVIPNPEGLLMEAGSLQTAELFIQTPQQLPYY